ncbi:hypothetical protein FRB96_001807 [Tulasnella sp. 330]|nr:hypothetical protein FRB96_001807 [Tulasnella sp. 330]KAG8880316.1 hypothetical protein FRB97_000929 [Tulasnella sp. 331]
MSDQDGFLNVSHLFPCAVQSGFTSAPGLDGPNGLTYVPLSDDTLNIAKVSKETTHEIVEDLPLADPGTKAWRAVFPEGSINPNNKTAPKGGFGFYLGGPGGDFAFENAKEILFSYAVYFEPGFEFVRGGKLPGPYGGSTPEIAYGCSGGRKEDRDQCFSLRLMWRRNGDGEIYAYLPLTEENTDVLCKVPPKSEQNPDYGFSVGRGAWRFKPGKWTVIAQRVKLNDIGVANGEIDIWANGEKVICATGIVIRENSDTVVRGAHFQTFFGGHQQEWASPKTQCALFANISGGIIQRL